jgi:hypothetical protein
MQLARAVGARGVLVRSGIFAERHATVAAEWDADAIVDNLAEAVGWILRHL